MTPDPTATHTPRPSTPPASAGLYPNGLENPPLAGDLFLGYYASFEAVTYKGTGPTTLNLPQDTFLPGPDRPSAGTVTATVSDSARTAVWTVDEGGTPIDTLVNVGGPYEGTTAYGLDGVTRATGLTIETTGAWEVTVGSLATDHLELAEGAALEGRGDAVFRIPTGMRDELSEVTFSAESPFTLTTLIEYAVPFNRVTYLPKVHLAEEPAPGQTESRDLRLVGAEEIAVVKTTGEWSIAPAS